MILIDTGPLVALFNPRDADHNGCHAALNKLQPPLYTTEAILTELFHILAPNSQGANLAMQFFLESRAIVFPLEKKMTDRCFELMDIYSTLPMDFADATLVAVAESLGIASVFTLDSGDFSVYRFKKGRRNLPFKIIDPDPKRFKKGK